ncbi:MAG: hypothetical protein V1857_06850 [archaeon]
MSKKNKFVNIPVKPDTYQAISKLGNLSTTYDDIVRQLLESYQEVKRK